MLILAFLRAFCQFFQEKKPHCESRGVLTLLGGITNYLCFSNPLFPIQICDCELQNCRENHPQEIWNVRERNPAGVGVYRHHRPDERREDEQNINRGEQIVFETELERGEREIENEIQNKWQKHQKRYPALEEQKTRIAKSCGDNHV
jgi:hypothetical protein